MNKPFVPPSMPWTTAGEWQSAVLPTRIDPRLDLDKDALLVASRNAYPVIAKQKVRSDSFGLLAGAAIALVLGGITFASMNSGRSERSLPLSNLARQPVNLASVTRPSDPPTVSAMPGIPGMPATAMNRGQPGAIGFSGPATTGAPLPKSGMSAPDHGYSPVVVFDASNPVTSALPRSVSLTDPATPSLLASSGNQGTGGTDASSVRSTSLGDPANTIVQGTLIPAVLETAIQSDLPGFARAVVSHDVRSFDGSKILVPRSSRLIGEYKGGITAGQKRVYLMWTRLVRPDGVSIALASPAVDSAGQTGIGGKVSDHFLQRFGSAILLTLLGSASAIGSGGATVVLSAGGQSAASVAAQHDGQRAPTIRVMQGEPIRVFTARDLVFTPTDGLKG